MAANSGDVKFTDKAMRALTDASASGTRLYLPPNLDRKIYQEIDAALSAAGGKWNRSEKAHVFDAVESAFAPVARDVLDRLLLDGGWVNERRAYDAFYTPEALAKFIVKHAGVGRDAEPPAPPKLVLEPSAGGGALVTPALQVGARVIANEIREAEANRLHHTLSAAAATRHPSEGPMLCGCGDFLAATPRPIFDAVIMNPPFSKAQDANHVLHAAKFLNPEGRLVAVLSASAVYRKDAAYRSLQALVMGVITPGFAGRFHALPEGSFKASGTMVSTVLLTLDGPLCPLMPPPMRSRVADDFRGFVSESPPRFPMSSFTPIAEEDESYV